MPANHSITSPRSRLSPLSSSSKRSSPFKRRYPRNLLHIPLNGDWTDDIFWTLSNTTTNPSDMNNITNTITTTTSNTTKSSSNHNTTATCVTYKKSLPSRRRHKHRQSLTPSYRTKLDQFRRAFRGTPVDTDRLLVDYSCALSKNNNGLLLQGRMYITETWVCFYSKILYEQKIFLSVNEIVSITKEKTARVIPNAIQILYSKSHERFFFTSFASRERTYSILRKVWENCRNHQAMSIDEILQQIRDMYGDHSLAVVEDEDTDGDPDLPSNTYSHRLRTLSDSSICSQLTGGTCHSKSISLEDVWQSDQPMHIDQSSNDELKPVGSDGEMLMIHSAPHALSDSNQFNSINEDDHKRNKEMNTIRRCLTPELIYPITQLSSTVSSTASSASSSSSSSRLLNIPDEILSDSIHTTNNNNSSRSGKEKKKRIRKRRHHQHHHSDEISSNTRLADTCQHNIMKPIMNTTIDITSSTPVYCSPRHDHPGRVYIDTDISMNVNALFNCIFTDSEFFSRLNQLRGTFNMIQSSWPTMNWSNSIDESNSIDSTLDIVNKVERTISYTLTLKQKLGPRTCTAVEQQTLLMSESEFGKRYVIDAKVTNQAVPLCNCFCVISRYCLLCINSTTSRLHICSQVIYKKPVFFGAKSIIENTCHSGLTDFFNTLVEQLKEYTKDLSIEERLTGGWLTQKRDCKPLLLSSSPTTTTAMITTPLPPPPTITTATTSSQMNHRIPRVIIQGDYKNKPTSIHSTISLNRENVNYTHHYNNNNKKSSIPSRCSELMKSTAFNNYNNTGGMIIKRQNKTDTFASNTNDMTYLFMRPDRAWLLLVIISLLLCLFLSMVYNRLVVLEKLAEQFSPSSSTSSSDSRDQNHISDLFGSKSSEEENPLFTSSSSSSSSFTIQNDQGSIPVYRSQSSISTEWPRTKLKIMKDLIHLLSKTLTQMQQTLTQVRQGIELLETPPVNMPPIVTSGDDGDIKGNMNIPMMNPIVEYSSNTENNPVT